LCSFCRNFWIRLATVLETIIDDLLDRTVLGGYTSLGYRLRQRSWPAVALAEMPGKVVMVTGAASGLGLAAAAGFAKLGASVWLVVRSQARGEEALAALHRRGLRTGLEVGVCDLGDLHSVRRFAQEFQQRSPRLDVLVNNAGVLSSQRELSKDGIELTFAVNVVAPFLLTNLLLPRMLSSAPARVVNVASGGMYLKRLRVDDLQSERGRFDGAAVYARTKRAEVVLTELFAQRLDPASVAVHAMHPGWADTPGLRASLPGFHRLASPLLRSAEQGADTIVWLGAAAAPAQSSGHFWHDRRIRPTHLPGFGRESEAERERLWSACVELAGLSDRPHERPWEMSDGALQSHS
jgi:NAD(P)-dependent dehydrogenase (short-subunit alcohol dehydrogenase family)